MLENSCLMKEAIMFHTTNFKAQKETIPHLERHNRFKRYFPFHGNYKPYF